MHRKTLHPNRASLLPASSDLRRAIVSTVLASPYFASELGRVAARIRRSAHPHANEKTIEGCFERELYALLKDARIDFSPQKEEAVDTRRHVRKGRVDSRIGAIVIEYKRPLALRTPRRIDKATSQLEDYVEAVSRENAGVAIGFLTDGRQVRTVRAVDGLIASRSGMQTLSGEALLRLVRNIISLDLDELSPATLIRDFCGRDHNGPIYDTARTLYDVLLRNASQKTTMLRKEWEEIFKLGHNDISQQSRIQERRRAMAQIFGTELATSESEYTALFSLHTAYALLMKLMAYKLVSEIYFPRSTRPSSYEYESLLTADSQGLRAFCEALEDGSVFRQLGILNLLEGDFFSWYADHNQWSQDIGGRVQQLLNTLTPYIGAADVICSTGAIDLFRDLYEATVPQVVRATFGEFYTPYWLAQSVLDSAHVSAASRVIDPCCGSGTFLVAAIEKIRNESPLNDRRKVLGLILSSVVGLDLNPLAVLTARVNYFLHIADLLPSDAGHIVIPVYLADACHPPSRTRVDRVQCLSYTLTTLRNPIAVTLPLSAVKDTRRFMQAMFAYERSIRAGSYHDALTTLRQLVPDRDTTPGVLSALESLTRALSDLEDHGWNGIWARIITNFFTSGALGTFDAVVGNPPWVDWKNLPSGYRERIKSLCIDRGLFSGDRRTGGINLNVCALISFSCANHWLAMRGRLAFLMPKELSVQQSYQGWRRLMGQGPFYFSEFHDWSASGHPFDPIREDFMTYVFCRRPPPCEVYPVFVHTKRREATTKAATWRSAAEARKWLTVDQRVCGRVTASSTVLTFAENRQRLEQFTSLTGTCSYTAREGIEFYPQEVLLFHFEELGPKPGTVWVRNAQSPGSKYKVPATRIPLETRYLFPLVKGRLIDAFEYKWDGLMVAFPYERTNPHRPLDPQVLHQTSPLLLEYYRHNANILRAQTPYSDKIRGPNAGDFYGLARTGPYSFADVYAAFRDNTSWRACVVSTTTMPWGEKKRFVFQNHGVSICERAAGGFITEEEAHYVCAILNAPTVEDYLYATSDRRSFKIRPQIYLPIYDPTRQEHFHLAALSMRAHARPEHRSAIRATIDLVYAQMRAARPK
jgi:hypothetical protein